jgi:hypothetical protein
MPHLGLSNFTHLDSAANVLYYYQYILKQKIKIDNGNRL